MYIIIEGGKNMSIRWLNDTTTEGIAILYKHYLQTNRQFVDKFLEKESVLVGLNDDTDQIILKPLNKIEHKDPAYQNRLRLNINIQKTFIRFGNTESVRLIASTIHVDVPKEGLRGTCIWDEATGTLVITLGDNK